MRYRTFSSPGWAPGKSGNEHGVVDTKTGNEYHTVNAETAKRLAKVLNKDSMAKPLEAELFAHLQHDTFSGDRKTADLMVRAMVEIMNLKNELQEKKS